MARLSKKKTKDLYLRAQRGGGFVGPVFNGRIQKQTGHGQSTMINSMLQRGKELGRRFMNSPYGQQVKKTIKRTGIRLVGDAILGKNLGQSVKKRGMNALNHLMPKPQLKNPQQHNKKRKGKKKKKGKNMKGGRLGKLPRQTYTVLGGKGKRNKNVFGD